jgi:2-keto-3-deoxy-L-rhamnonate aldolase RhmA
MVSRQKGVLPMSSERLSAFRRRLLGGERLIGTFVRTPHPVVAEILGLTRLDCICIDTEHSPFDRSSIDTMLLASRAADLPTLVRVPAPDEILNALDLGATGIVIPHVISPLDARNTAKLARFGRSGRGYAGSTRAAGYSRRSMGEIVREANAVTTVIAQIEDAEALNQVDEIAAVDGLDCLFVGRMDLTLSLGAESPMSEEVEQAVETICAAARQRGKIAGMFAPSVADALQWSKRGASFFLLESDHRWLADGAERLAAQMSSVT